MTTLETLRNPATSGKIVLLILGVIINGFGLYSHFDSDWVKKIWLTKSQTPIHVEMYKICEIYRYELQEHGQKCPDIAMEWYFISVIIICFVFSIVEFVLAFRIKARSLLYFDVGYHILAGALLLPAGVVYIVSDVQIEALLDPEETGELIKDMKLRLAEKRIAGGLTIIAALLYFCVARTIYKYPNPKCEKDGSYKNQFDTL